MDGNKEKKRSKTSAAFNCHYLQVEIVNPRMNVMEKMISSNFVQYIGKVSFFVSTQDVIEARKFLLNESKQKDDFSQHGADV